MLLSQTTDSSVHPERAVLGFRAGVCLFASLLQLQHKAGQSAQGPWAAPPGSAQELQHSNFSPPASPLSTKAMKKTVLGHRKRLHLPGVAPGWEVSTSSC